MSRLKIIFAYHDKEKRLEIVYISRDNGYAWINYYDEYLIKDQKEGCLVVNVSKRELMRVYDQIKKIPGLHYESQM